MLCQPETPYRAKIAHAYLLWPQSKPWPNNALEPTAPMAALWHAGVVTGAAAHRGR